MPLRRGRSRAIVSENISTLVREGRPKEQAIAIAMREAKIDKGGRTMAKRRKKYSKKKHSKRHSRRRRSAKQIAAAKRNLKKARAALRRKHGYKRSKRKGR